MSRPRRYPSDDSAWPRYVYRRDLTLREVAPAIGVGVGVGAVAFYLARLLLQRTPLTAAPPRAAQLPGRRIEG